MLYLSQVLGRPILDLDGERVATLRDAIVRLGADEHPPDRTEKLCGLLGF